MLRVFPCQDAGHVVRNKNRMPRLAIKADHPFFQTDRLAHIDREHCSHQMKSIMPPRSPYLLHRDLHRLANRQLRAFRTRHYKIEGHIPRERALSAHPKPDLFFVAAEIDHWRALPSFPGMNARLPEYSHREVRDLLHIDRRIVRGPEETF